MDERLQKLVFGCLLHDIGKVVQRSEFMEKMNSYNHSEYGEKYAREYLNVEDEEILEQILYHHEQLNNKNKIGLKEAYLDGLVKEDSLAFITYCADNITSGCDRRYRAEDTKNKGWKWNRALHSVFNCIYSEDEMYRYNENVLMKLEKIPYPEKKQFSYTTDYYIKQLEGFLKEVKLAEYKPVKDYKYINSLISLLEKYFTFMADDTANNKLADISLFDHLRMTAAFGSCLYLYAKENSITNYYKVFMDGYGKQKFYSTKSFLIIRFEMSGIQKFVYSIPSEGALKNMRGRSFYVNLLMEYFTDTFLQKIDLSRANVLYMGGGSAVLLVPNLTEMHNNIEKHVANMNRWLVENFQTTLYMEYGCCSCSAYDFRTSNTKKYKEKMPFTQLLLELQRQIMQKRTTRFSANMIREINPVTYSEQGRNHAEGERECKVCHSTSQLIFENDSYLCPVCYTVQKNANKLLAYNYYTDSNTQQTNKDLFLVENCRKKELDAFLLPFDKQMRIGQAVSGSTEFLYNKNDVIVGKNSGIHFWTGDYVKETTLEQMAKRARGIERIAVIRADVDNLGESFVNGLTGRPAEIDRDTISRKATYSRMLSLFFQYYINGILKYGKYDLELKENEIERNAAVVYSGGDDLFIVGGWDDIIGFAVDLYNSFKKYAQEKLTLSAGIGIYPPKYPISAIAKETGELEMLSKRNRANHYVSHDKDSVTLFSEEFTFHWKCFIEKVLDEKYKLIKVVFDSKESGERGIAFLYKLLELLKNIKNNEISLARYAFLIATLEPGKNKKRKGEKGYQEFETYKRNYLVLKEKLYYWMKNACIKGQKDNDEDDVKQCIVAIYIYLYLRRKDNDGESTDEFI